MLEKYWWAFPLIGFGLGIGTGWLEARVYNPWRKRRALEEAAAWESIAECYYPGAPPYKYCQGMCKNLSELQGLSWFTRRRMEMILRKMRNRLYKEGKIDFGFFWHLPHEGDWERIDFCRENAFEARHIARMCS